MKAITEMKGVDIVVKKLLTFSQKNIKFSEVTALSFWRDFKEHREDVKGEATEPSFIGI